MNKSRVTTEGGSLKRVSSEDNTTKMLIKKRILIDPAIFFLLFSPPV